MKKRVYALLLLLCFSFSSASVNVHNYSVGDSYSPFDFIDGEINLTIDGVDYDEEIVSNDGDSIMLGDFLVENAVDYDCSPADCSRGYRFSGGELAKAVDVFGRDVYAGFVLRGEDVVLKSLTFKIGSDFEECVVIPLSIDIFEEETWEFDEFSDSLLDKKWGCYDEVFKKVGPLINENEYCEMIDVLSTKTLNVGVDFSGIDDEELNMDIYTEDGFGEPWGCDYDPSESDGCDVSAGVGEVFSSGKYQVCVSSSDWTDYKIYEESVGNNCGFIHDEGVEDSEGDYAIFARGYKFADAGSLSSVVFDDDVYVAAANEIIEERYGGDCSDGCVLPLRISGVAQNFSIYDVDLSYTENFRGFREHEVYDLSVSAVYVDFDGVLDLELLGFNVSENGYYIVSLDGSRLFKEKISVLDVPVIDSVGPLIVPASVPVTFYADVDFSDEDSLSYKWTFGKKEKTTKVPYVPYTYDKLGDYDLSLRVSGGGDYFSSRSFNVSAISPVVAVDDNLGYKRAALNRVVVGISKFPFWYREVLSDKLNVSFYDDELDDFFNLTNGSLDEDDYIDIAQDLYSLNVPSLITSDSFSIPFLDTSSEDIDVAPIVSVAGSIAKGSSGDYSEYVLGWQNRNVDVSSFRQNVFVTMWNGMKEYVVYVYDFNITSKYNGKSYFVINEDVGNLVFDGDVGAKGSGDFTVIELGPKEAAKIRFYSDTEVDGFFVSPDLSEIILPSTIDTTCDHNSICDSSFGETPENCRSDCRPVGRAVLYIILSLVFLLVIYTILQIWYKHKYEKFLFKDGAQLYNLLMYISNARAGGKDDSVIEKELTAKGWSLERVDYAIKKSWGQRTGLYEIIPISKISAFFRNKKAKEKYNRGATLPKQQFRRNINKSGFRGV